MRNFIKNLQRMHIHHKLLFFVSIFLTHCIVAMEITTTEEIATTVNFPAQYIALSNTMKTMATDISPDVVEVALPASQDTINDVFTIFKSYRSQGSYDEIRDMLRVYSLERLVSAVNLLQHLEVADTIMDIVMDQIAVVLNEMLEQLSRSLSLYKYEENKNIIIPYYEPLRKLNPDVEKIIKASFKIKNILQIQLHEIWKIIGMPNALQKDMNETIASFLDKNVMALIFRFIEQDQMAKQKVQMGSSTHNSSDNNLSSATALKAAALDMLWKLYHYMTGSA